MRFDAFELDESNARLRCGGVAVVLAPTPFAVLCALVRRPGSLLSTNALLDAVWGHQFVTDSVLRTAISQLRTTLGDDAREPRYIETVSRRGYRFIAATAPARKAVQAHEMDLPEQPSCMSSAATPLRLCGARDVPCEHVFVCAVPKTNTAKAEAGCALPEPAFATMEEVRYAHELKLRLRARLLREVPATTASWSSGND
ncbi:MAG TPA: winged helix-turn-helix domain-containing protein [Casimicrobiaceae bacterium]|nr:winged helix-turn-helix domain-containing protein [Casimicrobiaceae bacterium]